jgi:hypothetical protein
MPPAWSGRAQIDLADLRDAPTPLFADCQTRCWCTFAGGKANSRRAALLRKALGDRVSANNLSITVADEAARRDVAVRQAIADLRPRRGTGTGGRCGAPGEEAAAP